MASLPVASLIIDDTSGSFGVGTDYLVLMGVVAAHDDYTPRVMASTQALLDFYGYSPLADYAAMHFAEASKPVIVVGMEAATNGTIGGQDDSGVSGSSTITVSGTPYEKVDAEVIVLSGGTIGTDQIKLSLSLDGGRTEKTVRLGTAASYAIPYVGVTLNFGGGTLNEDDVFTFRTTAPRWDQAGLAAARAALAAQLKGARSWLLVGDLADGDDADDVLAEVNGYETENDRFVYVRCQVRDQRPLVQLSHRHVHMSGSPSLTFAASGDTITRSGGSWIDDGFVIGDVVTVSGSVSNNVTGVISTLSATVLTFSATSLADEGPVANVSVVGTAGLVFEDSADTITRSSGSWLLDGFRAGDSVTITGTGSNNVTQVIQTVTAGVMTLTALTDESVSSDVATIVGTLGEEMADWVSNIEADFEDVDEQKRIDLSAGYARKLSPITGYKFRRPISWALSLREYQHDVQIPSWRKADGPLDGWDLEDEDGVVVEYDQRVQGGLLEARFSCARTYANGPRGCFGALSLTRANEGSLLSRTHNMAVVNVFSTVVQAETENFIGQVLELNSDGTATEASLAELEARVNTALAIALLQRKAEGPRASAASWTASRTDVLNIPGAELTGQGDILLNGTIEKITTRVRVQTAGA